MAHNEWSPKWRTVLLPNLDEEDLNMSIFGSHGNPHFFNHPFQRPWRGRVLPLSEDIMAWVCIEMGTEATFMVLVLVGKWWFATGFFTISYLQTKPHINFQALLPNPDVSTLSLWVWVLVFIFFSTRKDSSKRHYPSFPKMDRNLSGPFIIAVLWKSTT